MSAQMIHLHPRLFARSSVDGPDDLAAELAAAGMLAASWQVEALQEELDALQASYDDVPLDYFTQADADAREASIAEDAKTEALKAFDKPLEALEELLDAGGRLKRSDVEAIAQAMREIVG